MRPLGRRIVLFFQHLLPFPNPLWEFTFQSRQFKIPRLAWGYLRKQKLFAGNHGHRDPIGDKQHGPLLKELTMEGHYLKGILSFHYVTLGHKTALFSAWVFSSPLQGFMFGHHENHLWNLKHMLSLCKDHVLKSLPLSWRYGMGPKNTSTLSRWGTSAFSAFSLTDQHLPLPCSYVLWSF